MKKLILVSMLFSFVAVCSAADPKDSGTTYAKDALAPFIASGQLPGAVNVFYKDGVQETACLGYADAGKKRPIAMDSAFMQCSQTKGFCGVTIAILVEEGKIKLDDPVSKYLPEFKTLWIEQPPPTNGVRKLVKAKNTLTVRMVMNHSGGFPFELPNFTTMGGWSRRMPLRSVAAIAAATPIKFEPGTKYSYSNVGIDIGATIVEKVTGKRWEAFLKERVLDPLGMKDSTFWPTEKQLAGQVEMYDCRKGKPAAWKKHADQMQRPYSDDRVFASAGAGLWTTARDQLKFYKMLMNLGVGENGVRILKEETVKSILATSTLPVGLGKYSLGLTVSGDGWFGHGGAWGTNCMVNPEKKQLKLWVVQLRGGPRPWDGARNAAADKFFNAKLDNSAVDAYTGRLK